MRDARAHACWVLLEVDGLFDDRYYSGFRFHSQPRPLSPSLPDSTPPIRLSIGLFRICPEARCQAATQAAICHAKAARRRLLSSRSTVPAQGPTRYMHMLRGFQRGSLCACTRALARGHVQAVAHRLHLDLLELQFDRRRRPVAAQRSEHQRQRRARHQGTATVGVVHHGDPACAVSKSVSKSASKSVSKSASQSINQSISQSKSVSRRCRTLRH